MCRALIVTCACALWVLTVGCEHLATESASAPTPTAVVAQVVARVGGREIGAAEVQERMTLDGIGSQAAVDAIVEEELLLQEVRRAGLPEDPEAARRVDRTMVRALLHDLEKENTPEGLPDRQVREDFKLNREQFQVLERRGSWHVLVKANTEEAREVAASILAEARKATDPREVFDRYANGAADDVALPVVVEELPAVTMKAQIEKPYKDALFKAKTSGPLKDPISTTHGWHAIVVTEIQPGEVRTLADVEDEIRERLSRKQRFERLAEVVQRLEAEEPVDYDEALVKRLMTVQRLPKRAE